MVLKLPSYLFYSERVLDPYKLTWFSNLLERRERQDAVLDPYKLTWFSNCKDRFIQQKHVLDPYKLTWFSNVLGDILIPLWVLDPYKLTWFSNLKFKNFTVLTELLHTDICCKPIFLIPRCIFYHLKLNQAILLIQYMIIFTVQPFFL